MGINIRKFCKENQSGRSMIEMLGVLAIVMVISVGGIAGYSKAMMKFKISQISEDIGLAVAEIHSTYFGKLRYGEISDNEDLSPYLTKTRENRVYFAMTKVKIKAQGLEKPNDGRAFMVNLNYLPRPACVALATLDWSEGSQSALIGVEVAGDFVDNESDATQMLYTCKGSGVQQVNGVDVYYSCRTDLPMSPAMAGKYCDCGNVYKCHVGLKFF